MRTNTTKPYGFTKECVPHLWGNNGLFFRKIDFDNGYAVSIVHHANSYGSHDGLFELAVMRADTCELVYDTPVTRDVLASLDFADVALAIEAVRALPRRCWVCNPAKTQSELRDTEEQARLDYERDHC